MFTWLDRQNHIIISETSLIIALILIVIILSFFSVKFKAIDLHATSYVFYKTHLLRKKKLVTTKRRSIPYQHVQRITYNSTIWDHITGCGNLILQTAQDDVEPVVLKSIKNPEEMEHKIHKLVDDLSKSNVHKQEKTSDPKKDDE